MSINRDPPGAEPCRPYLSYLISSAEGTQNEKNSDLGKFRINFFVECV